VLRGISVGEDETVAVGAELAVIDETADQGGDAAPAQPAPQQAPQQQAQPAPQPPAAEMPAGGPPPAFASPSPPPAPSYPPPAPVPEAGYSEAPPEYEQQAYAPPQQAPEQPQQAPEQPQQAPQQPQAAPQQPAAPAQQAPPPPPRQPAPEQAPAASIPAAGEGPYVTPLVRKLAAEHGVDLASVSGTGVGGRIRKQDVLEAARALRESGAPAAPQQQPGAAPAPPAQQAPAAPRAVVPSTLRGTTERLSRARQLIARRMVESLQTSAQLTTVVEADVTAIARLRERAKADFEAREGVRLSFLPFFAMATVEALKIHPALNAQLDAENNQVIYHDAEHLGVAVDTERGLMVPVIRKAGDLNIGGLARKIADLAARTRSGQVSPDDLAGGTFTLTNTGSRGALFDTPIINQPQVAILGTGTVVKRPVVMEDPGLGEVITVRSMVYLALTYDHRLIDGADAARFLATVKDRLEEGAFEAELGL
jgi:2-oxoglutarate dehydrogenase E2 component (dihydrolipoamide succinyltransferase)